LVGSICHLEEKGFMRGVRQKLDKPPSLLVVFNAHGYGGTELVFMRTCDYFIGRGWRVAVAGRGTRDFFLKFGKSSSLERIDFAPAGLFDYLICSGIGIGQTVDLAAQGLQARQCFIWAFGEAGLVENLACGFGLRLRLRPLYQFAFRRIYSCLLSSHLNQVNRLILDLVDRSVLHFSDHIGLAEATGLKLDADGFHASVVPIPIPIIRSTVRENVHPLNSTVDRNRLRFGWVGRISTDFKVYPLIATIDRLVQHFAERESGFKFTIVGDGNAMAELRLYVDSLDLERYDIQLKGFLPAEQTTSVLRDDVDIMFGMGTAALDAGCMNLASIVVSPAMSMRAASRCKYRWLFQSVGYSLGEFVEFGHGDCQPNAPIESLLNSYLRSPTRIAEQCKNYAAGFDQNIVFQTVEQRLDRSRIALSEISHRVAEVRRTPKWLRALGKQTKRFLRKKQ
jgi:hypothetical protein